MKTPIETYVIEKVRQARSAQHISQSVLAYGIGVSSGFIGQAETPKSPTKYNLNHLNEIAKFLGCSPASFFPDKAL